jgi:hypothetical protein
VTSCSRGFRLQAEDWSGRLIFRLAGNHLVD